jgi:hypothetical protein
MGSLHVQSERRSPNPPSDWHVPYVRAPRYIPIVTSDTSLVTSQLSSQHLPTRGEWSSPEEPIHPDEHKVRRGAIRLAPAAGGAQS